MEVYGEKPKRFTPEWWDYIWYYYKWHFIVTVVAIFMLVTSLTQCANQPRYDLKVTVASENEVVMTQTDIMKEYTKGVIEDITGNGEKEVGITALYTGTKGGAEAHSAQMTKLTVELSVPESYVFIMNRSVADMAIRNEILEKTERWAGDAESDGYVVSLKGSEQLRAFGLDPDREELYVGVGILLDHKKDDELEKGRYENGVKLARSLVGLE